MMCLLRLPTPGGNIMKQHLICALVAATMFMQDVRLAEVSGSVFDMEGKPIAQAQVVITNTGNGKIYKFATDGNGQFKAIGIMFGLYDVEISRADGRHIYSGRKWFYPKDREKLNVVDIDLSRLAPKVSLVPFKGPNATNWSDPKNDPAKLSPDKIAELRADNAKIAAFNRFAPDIHAHLRAENWPKALEDLQQLVKIAPYQWELYQNLGMVQIHLEKHQDAVQSLERGIQLVLDPATGPADRTKAKTEAAQMLMFQGNSYLSLNKMDLAEASFQKATEANPKLALAWLHLCTTRFNNSKNDDAIAACKQAVTLVPMPEFYQTLASIYNNLGQYEESIKTYQRGIEMAKSLIAVHNAAILANPEVRFMTPRIAQMLVAEGNVYFQQRDYAHAAEMFRRAAPLHSYPSIAYFNLCATLYDMDDMQGAIEACDKAIILNPKMADPYFAKASAMLSVSAKRGRHKAPEGMVDALKKYLELAPEGLYVTEARAMIQEADKAN